MTRKNLAADGALALVVFALLLTIMLTGGLDQDVADPRDPDALGVALVAAATLPVIARRLAPLPVYAVVSAATMALWRLRYQTDIPFGPLIAIYTLGSVYGRTLWSRRVWPVLAVAAQVPASALIYLSEGFTLGEVLVPDLLLWALVVAGAWVTGELARLRRERIADLEERVRRTEQEAERERRLAAAEERTRIARELHDSAGHALNVILVQAGAARLLHERDPAGSREAITTVEEVARDTIGEIDRLVRALREDDPADPVPADPAAIEELVERHRASGLRVDSDLQGSHRAVPRSVAWAAYRVLQEGLTNAARHGAGGATVAVRYGSDAVEITVTNPTTPHPTRVGHGIVGMRERASLLGGSLEAGPENGTFRLHARIPHAQDPSHPPPRSTPTQEPQRAAR